jgi:hypothetical protein
MNCDEAFRRLGDYLDGALPGPIGEELVGHLQACTPCADVRKDLDDLSRLSRMCPAPPLPEDLRLRIEAFLRTR